MYNLNNPESQKSFIASTVHEIRTPIQTILGTIELISDTKLDEEQKEYVRQIKFGADVLLTLANDILDFSKLESGKFKIEHIPCNIITLCEDIVDLICIEAHNKNLEIITDIDYSIPQITLSDPTRIQQILLNLIKNAVKFTDTGHVHIALSMSESKNCYLFKIIDTGIGISEQNFKNIFDDYFQADSSISRKFGGTGLGLAICKNIIELLQGSIRVYKNEPQGTVFEVAIPYTPCEKNVTNIKTIRQPQIAVNEKILLVDDNPITLSILQRRMNNFGITSIDTALSGKIALEKIKEQKEKNQPFTMIFIDMQMPVMDGWRLSAEINGNPQINNLKLYLMVPEGQMRQDTKMKMLNWFNGYLYKPIKQQNLIDTFSNNDEPLELEPVEQETDSQNENQKLSTFIGLEVLVVEDHPVNQKILSSFLEKLGLKVETAIHGLEALEKVRQNPDFSLIFMDIQMPVLDGLEATIQLRKENYKGIIIACTANSEQEEIKSYLQNGFNDTLIKPFKKEQLAQLLKKWQPVFDFAEKKNEIEENLVPIAKVWDTEDFLNNISQDIELALTLIEQFKEQTSSFSTKAKEAIANHNFSLLSKIAHTLKGSSGTISAFGLAYEALRLEEACKMEEYEQVVDSYTQFYLKYNQFIQQTDKYIQLWTKKS